MEKEYYLCTRLGKRNEGGRYSQHRRERDENFELLSNLSFSGWAAGN